MKKKRVSFAKGDAQFGALGSPRHLCEKILAWNSMLEKEIRRKDDLSASDSEFSSQGHINNKVVSLADIIENIERIVNLSHDADDPATRSLRHFSQSLQDHKVEPKSRVAKADRKYGPLKRKRKLADMKHVFLAGDLQGLEGERSGISTSAKFRKVNKRSFTETENDCVMRFVQEEFAKIDRERLVRSPQKKTNFLS